MVSVDAVKAAMAGAQSETERANTGLAASLERLNEAIMLTRTATAGSVHPKVAEALARLEQAKERVEEAQALAAGAIQSATEYRSII